MAARRARQAALLSDLSKASSWRAPTRSKVDLEFSKHDDQKVTTQYGSSFQLADKILTETSSARDAFPTQLPGEFLPPEVNNISSLSSTTVTEQWAAAAGHQSLFSTPSDFISRVSGLGMDALASLIRAQCRSLSPEAAHAVARRLLSQLSSVRSTDIVSGVAPSRIAAAAAETTRQVASVVTQRGPKDFHAVWEGGDPSALEALCDVLARAESSQHVAVVDALTRLASVDGAVSRGGGVMPHHLLAIRVRTRAVATWVFDHTLVDVFGVLYWILFPFIEATKRSGGREDAQVGPLVLPRVVDEKGGTTQTGESGGHHVVVYMIPAAKGEGTFFINGEPYTTWRRTARSHSPDAFGMPFSAVGARLSDFNIWAEGFHIQSAKHLTGALNVAFARGLAALDPSLRPVLRMHHHLRPSFIVPTGTRPGFAGWRINKTVKKR